MGPPSYVLDSRGTRDGGRETRNRGEIELYLGIIKSFLDI